MNFELASMSLGLMADDATDLLLVLVPDGFKPGRDRLSRLIGEAMKSQALETKAGKLLSAWRAPGVAAQRLVLAGAGDMSAVQVRTAVVAAMALVKSAAGRRLTIGFAGPCTGGAMRAAVQAVADGSYVYTTTKSKPEGRKLHDVVIAVADDTCPNLSGRPRHWLLASNGPRNGPPSGHHATPSIGRGRPITGQGKIECTSGPKQVAAGHGFFPCGCTRISIPLRFIELRYDGAAGRATGRWARACSTMHFHQAAGETR
jgi:leucyl aminopeptidase